MNTSFTLKQCSDMLQSKTISAAELAKEYLQHIEASDSGIRAFVATDAEKTQAEAEAADRRLQTGSAGVLTGVPIAYKDIFCHEGWRSACSSKMLDPFVSPYTATVVRRLSDAGMVTLGRTNMDEFAMGSTTETSFYGETRNPWNTAHVPGGSSGGSAAAVAAQMAPAALGSDTGGSVRQPASHCGITGLKPTYGVVSRYGMVAYASSFDQAGPMAQTAEDCALLLNVMSGFDERDSTSARREKEDYSRQLEQPLSGLKVGLPEEFFGDGLDDEVRAVADNTVAVLKDLGAEIVSVRLPNTELSIPAYYVLTSAEASTNLSRYDGVRYGFRAAGYEGLDDMYSRTRTEGFGSEVKRRIMIGTYVLSHGYYDAYYLKAQKLRRLVADDFQRALASCDVILGPVAPTAAPLLGSQTADPVQMYLSDIYTVSLNLAGLPGLSLPAGFTRAGLPVGMQLIGNYFQEARLLNAAHKIQQATDAHSRRPG